MHRRRFLLIALTSAGANPFAQSGVQHARSGHSHNHAASSKPFPLSELSVTELAKHMGRSEITAERLVKLYLERIEQIDRSGPTLRAVIETNPDAIAIARILDQERKSGHTRGPLHGIPVLIKDNIDTGDKMQTTAGSLALVGRPAGRDAFLVDRLRQAGAILLGKTNLSEWANFRSTRSTSGWSARGGQTLNPYVLDRNPCGSSSGSAVAVSSNLCALAVGTETDGSVICPSSISGIVGIKPTLGLISRAGIIPIAHSQDTAGPMARSVRDAAILLGALAGPDPHDDVTETSAAHLQPDYTTFLDPDGLRGARLGVVEQYFEVSPAVKSLVNESLLLMKKAGAELVEDVAFSRFEEWRDTETQVLVYEFKRDLNAYLAGRSGSAVRSLAECIAFNRAHHSEEMPYFGQEQMEAAEEGAISEKEYRKALDNNHRLTRREGIDALLKKHKLDALVAPTAGAAWTTDWVNGDHVDSGCSSPPAVAGYPHITVPAGQIFGLPIGLSFFAEAWSEPKLIKLAYSFEQLRQGRSEPRFLPSLASIT